jgi:hypothetical protein
MKHKQHSLVLAGLLALAFGVTACSSMRHGETSDTSGGSAAGTTGAGCPPAAATSGTSGTAGTSAAGAEGSSGTAGAAGAGMEQQPQAGTSVSTMPNATVVSIEMVPAPTTIPGASSTGGSAAGATGSSTVTGQQEQQHLYRVTLHMDDGSTKVVTQETSPGYHQGDRINLTSGIITH